MCGAVRCCFYVVIGNKGYTGKVDASRKTINKGPDPYPEYNDDMAELAAYVMRAPSPILLRSSVRTHFFSLGQKKVNLQNVSFFYSFLLFLFSPFFSIQELSFKYLPWVYTRRRPNDFLHTQDACTVCRTKRIHSGPPFVSFYPPSPTGGRLCGLRPPPSSFASTARHQPAVCYAIQLNTNVQHPHWHLPTSNN